MAGCLRSHCLAWSGCANVLRDKWTLGCDRATFGFLQCSIQEGWLWGQRRLDGGRRGGGLQGLELWLWGHWTALLWNRAVRRLLYGF